MRLGAWAKELAKFVDNRTEDDGRAGADSDAYRSNERFLKERMFVWIDMD